MRRTPPTDESQTVSLFPFLAVLLSTMGALLLLLVVMARQARLEAAHRDQRHNEPPKAQPSPDAPADAVSPADLQQLEEQAARLRAVREEGLQEFEASRLRLRHGDQHLRQLQDEVAALYRQAHDLEERGESRLDDHERARKELERLHGLIRDTEERLQKERQAAESQQTSYAIVPYEGPHGTRRRPLYIECRRDGVVLQPEGITLSPSDFQGPLGPGNPLASALRAAEAYYDTAAHDSGPDQRPYPLVLVRPDGIAPYYFVRKALEGWGTEFGYELLDGPWQLEFPLPNPELANVQQQAVDLARMRQKALAMAAPGRYGGGGGGSLSGEDADTFEGLAGSPLGDLDGEPELSGDQSGTTGRRTYGDRYVAAQGAGTESTTGPQPGDGAGSAAQYASGGPAMRGSGEFGASGGGHGNGQTSNGNSAATSGPANAGVLDGQAKSATSAGGAHGSATNGSPGATGSASSGSQSFEGSPAFGAAGADTRPAGDPHASVAANAASQSAHEPLARHRGANWAVPQAGSGAVPVRRTIHVVARHDRLALLPEAGTTSGRVIPVDSSIERAVDPLVEAVAESIQSWGTAGQGLYWQPILVFTPGPDGMAHTAALRRLLAGSGLEITP